MHAELLQLGFNTPQLAAKRAKRTGVGESEAFLLIPWLFLPEFALDL